MINLVNELLRIYDIDDIIRILKNNRTLIPISTNILFLLEKTYNSNNQKLIDEKNKIFNENISKNNLLFNHSQKLKFHYLIIFSIQNYLQKTLYKNFTDGVINY